MSTDREVGGRDHVDQDRAPLDEERLDARNAGRGGRADAEFAALSEPGADPGVQDPLPLDGAAQLRDLRQALSSAGVSSWRWERASSRFTWDEASTKLHGKPCPRSMERYLNECVHPDDRARVEAGFRHAVELGRFEDRAYRVVAADGAIRWVLASARDAADSGVLIGVMLDVTHHRELEEQLRYSQKMEAIGTLTAGIAHNFNNILMVILPTLDFVAPMVPERESEFVRGAAQAARRGAELVRHLMTFSGQTWSSRSVHKVDDIVASAVSMFGNLFDSNAVLTTRSEDPTASVLCDPGEIQQVLFNLLLNARDAVLQSERGRGTITLSVRKVERWRSPLHERRVAGPAVCIEVTDDGRGMTEGVKAKAFEPFFTTKEVGQGTGLGLATSYAIVRDHEGTLTCESVPRQGTTFTVLLPRVIQPVPEARRESLVLPRGLRVLLVDDDSAVRSTVSHVLRGAVAELLQAAGGGEALALLERHRDVDVVLLDFAMPDGPGASFVPRIRSVAPAAKILFFTGLRGTSEMSDLADGVVLKPVGEEELLKAIARVTQRDAAQAEQQ